ncbi:DNA-directed RNA polymerase, mitochondrial-like isoform X2 [Ischnura elegans]|uniref:DNA-directed RNA polymerase, mitochondrial-like isoform X2 n=1 Tax=Ischnura elegans TaxID=197161 RepID=UPI001ED8A26F|nr:DNA-directed RNA polymerase, mitochondrial-like isoform X2 [Ischnura elegans]
MYRIFAHRMHGESVWVNLMKTHAGCQASKNACPCRNTEHVINGRRTSSVIERSQVTWTNTETRLARKRRRYRRHFNDVNLSEVARLSSSSSGAPASSLKSKDLDMLIYPDEAECTRVSSTIRKIENAKKVTEMDSTKSLEALWDVKHDEHLGPEYLPEVPEDNIGGLSEHVDPISFHEVESEPVSIVEGEFMDNDSVTHLSLPVSVAVREKLHSEAHGWQNSGSSLEIPQMPEKDQEKPSLHLKKKRKKVHSHKKHTVEKGRKAEIGPKAPHKEALLKARYSKAELAAREESFMQSLLSYVDTCVSCGFLSRGWNALMFYRDRGKRADGHFRISDSRVFEVLLHGYAARRNIAKVEELMRAMSEDGIVQTAQCYAACFECMGRRLERSSLRAGHYPHGSVDAAARKKLRLWASEMSQKGISLNDLFAGTCLLADQRKMVMESILKIDPHFKAVWPPCPEFGYSCRLLQDLNYDKPEVYHSPVSGLFDGEQLKEFTLEQLQTELRDCLEVKSIELREEPNELVLFHREKLAQSHEEWREVILNALSQDLQTLQNRCQRGVIGHRFMNLYPFLASVKKEELVELVLQEIRKLAEGSETFSPSTNQLYRELGSRVMERYQVNWKEKTGILNKVKHLYSKYCDWYANPDGVSLSERQITCTRQAWQCLVNSHQGEGASLNFRERNWPMPVQIGIGKFLYDIILREIRIDINVSRPSNKKSHPLPAFYTLFRSQQQGKMVKEEVKPHPVLARLFRGAASDTLKFPAKCVPMLCPPTPWTTVTSGAYLLTKVDVIRLPQQALLQWNRLANCPTQQLYPALDSLNQLGAVPWQVNKRVLDVVIEVFNTGGSSQLAIPAPPSSFPAQIPLPPLPFKPAESSSQESGQDNEGSLASEKLRQHKHILYLRRKKAEAYSLWCDMLYRLSLANHFRDRVFWLPHNMDFRGRVYPCPPHLNHLGSDVARSLLCFAKGQPLGLKGLDWLKLHLVNLTGLMKRNSIKERMVFAEEMMPKIIDSAENPLTGEMWWAKSDEPWQTLAVCMEINAALKAEGGPEHYVCHFPVHQDGSCNGLQHYAALGRDAAGAASVSMAPSECPQDVYGVVAAMVERERAADAKLGVPVAKILDGFVRRKVIKQTVMTTVYGVTRFGARLQIARQLRDIDEFPKEYVWRASQYLVGKTFGCLREMFTSTKEIQDWFTDCARLISQVCGRSVEWVTPLGLPVVQPYHRVIGPGKRQGSADPLSSGFVFMPYGVVGNHERPNVMKQKNAFPPNFIHSIDSSHMMLTSLWCERKGLTFVSVHDCYWTHPSTVEVMNKICREQFVALHSEPILEDLSSFLVQNYGYPEEVLKFLQTKLCIRLEK